MPLNLDALKSSTTRPSSKPQSASQRPLPSCASRYPARSSSRSISYLSSQNALKIRNTHTILDTAAIVKELLENALDANANRIIITVRGKAGLDSVTCFDNGGGIAAADYPILCKNSTTSKITDFNDLDQLSTYGFRGAALAGICSIAGKLSITTRTATDNLATIITYNPDGELQEQSAAARSTGTTVHVENVFGRLPVRQMDARRNHVREISKCLSVIQAYAIICTHARVEFKFGKELKVTNTAAQSVDKNALGPKIDLPQIRQNTRSVLGVSTVESLVEVSDCILEVTSPQGNAVQYEFQSLVSKASLDSNGLGGRAKSTHHYIYVNKRPVEFYRLVRRIRELYRRATGLNSASPVVLMNIVLPSWACDVNLSPDKRVIAIHKEEQLIEGILHSLEEKWVPTTQTQIPVQGDLTQLMERPGSAKSVLSDLSKLSRGSSQRNTGSVINTRMSSRVYVAEAAEQVENNESPGKPSSLQSRNVMEEGLHNAHSAEKIIEDGQKRNPRQESIPVRTVPVEAANRSSNPFQSSNEEDICMDIPEVPEEEQSDDGNMCNSEKDEPQQEAEKSPNQGSSKDLISSRKPIDLSSLVRNREQTSAEAVPRKGRVARDCLMMMSVQGAGSRNLASFVARRSHKVLPSKRTRAEAAPTLSKVEDVLADVFHSSPRRSDVRAEGEIPSVNLREEFPVSEKEVEIIFDDLPNEPAPVATCNYVIRKDWQRVCASYGQYCQERTRTYGTHVTQKKTNNDDKTFRDATVGDAEAEFVSNSQHQAAAKELSRLFHQEWFKELVVLGQFNRGFIIAQLREDLFIIDQHASDEKFNFEDLQKKTVIRKQRLVVPRPLEMSAQDEILVMQYIKAFRAGGFDIEVRPQNRPTQRLFLKAQPISKHTMFAKDDLQDIIDLLKGDLLRSSSVAIRALRPPRLRAMFASRACRKSVMIGTALHKQQMEKIVRNLAKLYHPWSCPHGRPTMRHLCALPNT